MNCERIQELYTDYYEKSVSGTLLEAVDHHFKVCTDCRTDYARFEMAMKLLDVELDEVEVPTAFRAEILAKIESQPRKASVALGFWERLGSVFAPAENRQRYQLVTGFSVAAVVIAATLFSSTLFHTATSTGSFGIGQPPSAPASPQYSGLFRTISTEQRPDGRTYHDFTLHLPTGQASGTMDAYVIQDDKPLIDDAVLSDYSSVTPVWSSSQTLDSEHSLNVPVAVVSDVPAGNTLTFMVKDSLANGSPRREVAFVPVKAADSPTWNAVTIPQGTSLYNSLQTIASAGTVPIVLDNSVLGTTKLATFQSAATQGGEISEFDELTDALKSDPSLTVVQKSGADGNVNLYAIVAK